MVQKKNGTIKCLIGRPLIILQNIFGPNDLSASIDDFMNVFDVPTVKQIHRAVDILRKNNKYIGLAGGMDEATIRFWSDFDMDIIFAGADWNFIYSAEKQTLGTLHKHHLKK